MDLSALHVHVSGVCTTLQVKQYFRDKLKINLREKKQMFNEHDVEVISDITNKSFQVGMSTISKSSQKRNCGGVKFINLLHTARTGLTSELCVCVWFR